MGAKKSSRDVEIVADPSWRLLNINGHEVPASACDIHLQAGQRARLTVEIPENFSFAFVTVSPLRLSEQARSG